MAQFCPRSRLFVQQNNGSDTNVDKKDEDDNDDWLTYHTTIGSVGHGMLITIFCVKYF
jgi:hypothetical protein